MGIICDASGQVPLAEPGGIYDNGVSRGPKPESVYDEELRYIFMALAALSFIGSALWLAVAVDTLFYDSLGNYHRPTFGHIVSNTLIGVDPFVVPVVFLAASRAPALVDCFR